MIGKVISHYRILRQLGEGGMGVVYLAEDTRLGRQVALKFSTAAAADESRRARFLREARAASAITHPCVAAVYDYGETADGCPFIVMEVVRGEDLAHILKRGPLPLKETVRIAAAIAQALAEAHRYGIVHRDIKPSNVVVQERGQIKVLDFGLAKEIGGELASPQDSTTLVMAATIEGTVLGTPYYMSPEQARQASVGPASDLFSLGALLYECLAGKPAFTGRSSVEILGAVLHVAPERPSAHNPAVTPELDAITLKALAKEPRNRYTTAAEMGADLEAVLASMSGMESGAARISATSAGPHPARKTRGRFRPIAAGVLLAVLIAGAAWWLLDGRPYQPAPEALRWYGEGLAALRDGTYYKASMALERAVARDPNFEMAHARLAEAWLELDYADKAREELLRMTSRGAVPRLDRVDRLSVEALQATLTADWAGAAAKDREIVNDTPEPGKANAYVDLGRAYEKAEKLKDAISSYQEATRRRPQEPAAWLRLGILYGRQSDQTRAAAAFDQAESLYRGLSNIEGATEVLYERAVLANRSGRPLDARPLLADAAEKARASGDVYHQVLILIQMSSTALRLNEVEQSQRDAAGAVELARSSGLENLTTRGLIELGNAFFIHGDYEEGEKLFTQALEYARRYHAGRSEARALFSLGSLKTQRGSRDEGLRDVEQALAWYQRGGYLKEASLALILIGRTRRAKGEYEAALSSFRQQLEIARKLQESDQIAYSLEGIASVLEAEERWPEALANYRKACEMARQTGHPRIVSYNLVSGAAVLAQLGRYAEARQTLNELAAEKSPDIARQVAFTRVQLDLSQRQFPAAIAGARRLLGERGLNAEGRGVAKLLLGQALAFSGDTRNGEAATSEALAAAAGLSNAGLLSDAKLAHAEVLLAAGEDREALRLALEAQPWVASVGRLASEWRCWAVAARAEARAGSPAAAREYAGKASAVLARLSQRWDAESCKIYNARPDVQFDRTQLTRVSGAN